MAEPSPRVFTIAPDRPFLKVLAEAVLKGFPRADGKAPGTLELARWTILLPTRRAARELEDIFFGLTGGGGVLLPRIRPIGDIDEDLLAPAAGQDLPEAALSAPGQHLLLMDLIDDWAAKSPHLRLAQEIAAAPHQAHGLAISLAELLDSIETEDIAAQAIAELYGIEAAHHREAILDFLAIARETYPQRLAAEQAMGPMARRSAILRREAHRLEDSKTPSPFIAAGSTGSIPATCALLKAIAGLPNGAVVLPGLDLVMDEPSWTALGPTHPQHAMKLLTARLGITRQMVSELGEDAPTPRRWLVSEIMRPAETAHLWHQSLAGKAETVAAAMQGVELVETRSIPEQATTAALILRECLETRGRTGCLVTPDRQLARRVKTELARWNITINDSAGEPLIRYGGASLLNLLLDAILENFSATTLQALLRHDLALFGESVEKARRAASLIELALLRTGTGAPEISHLSHALRVTVEQTEYQHLVLRNVSKEEWEQVALHCHRISTVLSPLASDPADGLIPWLDRLAAACEAMAGEAFWLGEGGNVLEEAFAVLREEARHLRKCDLPRAAAIIRHWLRALPVRRETHDPTPLTILGLLEARLIRADVVVMAGLNEASWPSAPDCGPWLNRPMRDTLAMKQPEAQIGQTAHDFAQAFGARTVKLLWSKRVGDAPATPSRWVHRLQMILNSAGRKDLCGASSPWPAMARKLAEVKTVTPVAMPRPKPPVALRPKSLSVTRIEKLIRDPYAIYARHVLRLQPVDPITTLPDPARRGMIFHAAIGDFMQAFPKALPADVASELEQRGSHHFKEIADYPGLVSFWWPRFRNIARWMAHVEPNLRNGIERVVAETKGHLELTVAGDIFHLTCRADRIDLAADGTARIIDYKTGEAPSARQVETGLSPQLTLQAAVLAEGTFENAPKRPTSNIAYIRISGGDPAGEIKDLDLDVMALAGKHKDGLIRLLTKYADPAQPYLPRTMMMMDEDEGDYDHLSRFREWTLAGEVPVAKS